ncbi:MULTISPECIES: phage tail assembly chaperone [Maricaulis]|uniref:Phage tail assembly chaperone n=2 Tax=Maricaulis TaxID=74317 RepID=A0A9W6IKM6_9PROT|nr:MULTISPECIES: phage tail assembly chaperone [Maricaulis]GLK50706.1 phage tail assembly chaperone [Maricaulis virginensis]
MTGAMDWPAALRLAVRLGLTPHAFWQLSLAEWRALTGGAAPSLDRAALDALLQRYPDPSS